MAFQWENSGKLATYLGGEKSLIPFLKSQNYKMKEQSRTSRKRSLIPNKD